MEGAILMRRGVMTRRASLGIVPRTSGQSVAAQTSPLTPHGPAAAKHATHASDWTQPLPHDGHVCPAAASDAHG